MDTEYDRRMYKDIQGIDRFWEVFPDKPWCYFHEVLEFRWYRQFDDEEWIDRYYVDITLSDPEGKDVITLTMKGVTGAGNCEFSGWIAGLEIINLRKQDISHETHYEILDFEDSQIHFYCDDIEVKVLKINGEKIGE